VIGIGEHSWSVDGGPLRRWAWAPERRRMELGLGRARRCLDPKGTGQTRWTMCWKPALDAFAITFADRMPRAEQL